MVPSPPYGGNKRHACETENLPAETPDAGRKAWSAPTLEAVKLASAESAFNFGAPDSMAFPS